MNRSSIKQGDILPCLTKTHIDGNQHKVFYLYETALSWDWKDNNGNVKSGVVRSDEPYDGTSIIITDNGD